MSTKSTKPPKKTSFVCKKCERVYKLEHAFLKHKCVVEKVTFTCEHCKKTFAQEQSFMVHICEKKRRWMCKDDKPNRIGFMIFQKFWAMNYKTAKPRTYDHFVNSNLYLALVRFGKYIGDINAIRPEVFIDFLLKAEVPIDKWQSPVVYENYVRELAKKESPAAAVERNFLLMQQWALDTNEDWTDFFRKIPSTQATMWIKSGRISPWVLYLAPSAAIMMSKLSEEQIEIIQNTIEPRFWQVKIKANKKEADIIREQLELAGL